MDLDRHNALTTQRANLAADNIDACTGTSHPAGDSSPDDLCSLLIIAFQFPFESHLQENVASMARQYVRNVISSVQKIAAAMTPSGSRSDTPKLTQDSPETVTLANWICQSYRQVERS
ncbi:unnamed protein product [Ilex paraguariensis]|uniref:Uncharacterized protein n=1 Tax=Ilex paraguariensis TaxID=185542 RepID=A0ABC8TGT0_9AQUA